MAGAMAVVTVPLRLVWRLPGWRRRWRRRRLGAVMSTARTRVEHARALGLDPVAVARFRHAAVQAAVTPHRMIAAAAIAGGPIAAVGMPFAFVAAFAVHASYGPTADGGAGLVTMAAIAVLWTVLFVPDRVAARLGLPEPNSATVMAVALALSVAGLSWVRSPAADWTSDSVEHGVAFTATFGVVAGGSTALAMASMSLAMRLVLRGRDAAVADAIVVGQLASALAAVADEGAWSDATSRVRAAEHLEWAATTVERGLPERLRSQDAPTAAAVRQRCRRVAAAFREQELSVLLPGPGTPDAFREFVVAAATAVATGRLDDLPTADPPPGRTRRDVAAGLARTAVIASLPAAVFGVLQASAAAVDGAAAGSVTALCLAWAVLTVIAALDPLFRDKVAAVKEAAGLLRP